MLEEDWDADQIMDVKNAIKALMDTAIYEESQKDKGLSIQFLSRMTLLRVAAGMCDLDNEFERKLIAEANSIHNISDDDMTPAERRRWDAEVARISNPNGPPLIAHVTHAGNVGKHWDGSDRV